MDSHEIAPDSQSKRTLDSLDALDTGLGSILHHVFSPPPMPEDLSWMRRLVPAFITASLLWALPFAAVVLDAPNRWSALLDGELQYEWVMASWCILTIPCLLCFLLHERRMYVCNLKMLVQDKILTPPTADILDAFISKWRRKFIIQNVRGQLVSLCVSCFIGYIHLRFIFPEGKVGDWGGEHGLINRAGIICACWQLPASYWIIFFYIYRGLLSVSFLKDVPKVFTVAPHSSHHDDCGGLAPVGRFGIKNAYLMGVVGANVAVLWWAAKCGNFLNPGYVAFMVAAVLAYLLFGPLLIIVPLLPYARIMKDAKIHRLKKVGARLKNELKHVNKRVRRKGVAKDEIDSLQRLKDYRAMIDRSPTWPFDTKTQTRFISAYVLPLAMLLVTKLLNL